MSCFIQVPGIKKDPHIRGNAITAKSRNVGIKAKYIENCLRSIIKGRVIMNAINVITQKQKLQFDQKQ